MPTEGRGSEYELVLMVISNDPVNVLREVSDIASLADYNLQRGPVQKIRDIYFDTPDHRLGRRRINLRIRQASEQKLITLKKSPGILTRNRNQRQETELEWSSPSFTRIIDQLSSYGVRLSDHNGTVSPVSIHDPVGSFKALGLEIIQDRETTRQVRMVLSKSGELLAELALDSVIFHFSNCDILLDEVEIEAKSENGRSTLEHVSALLVSNVGPELKRWGSGKLSTGTKIERLLRNGQLKGLIGEEGRLRPEAYELLGRS